MFMSDKNFQKLLSAHVDAELCDLFLEQAYQRGFVKKRVLAASVKFWIFIPQEIQTILNDKTTTDKTIKEIAERLKRAR